MQDEPAAAAVTQAQPGRGPLAPLGHGPIMTGDAIHRAFDTVRELAGRPIIPAPGKELLDDLVARILSGSAA